MPPPKSVTTTSSTAATALHRPTDADSEVWQARAGTDASADVSIRQNTSAYVSIRPHTSAYGRGFRSVAGESWHRCVTGTSAYGSIRQHTSAYAVCVCVCVCVYAPVANRWAEAQRASIATIVSIRQHTSAYVSMRQRTSYI
jgi:hypothetical protein